MDIVTIGVYGFDESGFFEALERAHVDTFCDVRWRRGVRGAEYAFVNSKRLQARLAGLGIRYRHFRELAPNPSLRARQASADQAEGVGKRSRNQLSPDFISGYRQECLDGFDSRAFAASLGPETRVAALFCVEREPGACHRSLLADRLRADLHLEPVHLLPPS